VMFYTYIFYFIIYNLLLDNLPEGAPLVNEFGGAGMVSYLDVFFSHVMADSLDEALFVHVGEVLFADMDEALIADMNEALIAANLNEAPAAANLNEAPAAAKNDLIFGACILTACLGTACLGAAAYIQYTAPNLAIFLT